MAASKLSEVIQHLRRAVLLREGADLTDAELLECFVSCQEPAALEALVRRHGPMVWGVCQRILRNHHEAEDAFQATFLVLLRKAASISPRAKVGNWLYGVAHQTALKARATRAKRRVRERPVTQMPEPAATEKELWSDLQPLLDQELSRLPEHYRTAIVLCELEGKTGKEAARQLGIPEGTVASRLARARAMLAKRLARHGLAVSGGMLAAVLSQKAASACVPASVLSSTIKAVTRVAVGQAAATSLISAKVAALTEEVVMAMFLSKLKVTATLLLVVGVIATGTAGLNRQFLAGEEPKDTADKAHARAAVNATEKETRNRDAGGDAEGDKAERARLEGEWVFDAAQAGGLDVLNQVWNSRVTIKGNEAGMPNFWGKAIRSTFRLDPTKQPKQIDVELKFDAGLPQGLPVGTLKGIYDVDRDTMTVCLFMKAAGGNNRPTDFKAPAGSERCLLVLKRIPKAQQQGMNQQEKGFRVRLVDTEGKPVLLARVGTNAQFCTSKDGPGPEWSYFHQVFSGEDGIARFENREDIFGWVIARHYGRHLVAFEKVTPYRLATGTITLTMQPECRVSGRLACLELKRRKRDLGWTNVYLWVEGRGPSLGCASEEGTFHFFAPPGTYTLHAYGMKLHSVENTIVVKPGQRELHVVLL